MIRKLSADRPSFRSIEFKPGMNVVLADRTIESSDKDSTNGSGKTTIIEIIHFCLGASLKAGKGLGKAPLSGWTFSLELDVAGGPIVISRNTAKPGKVVLEGDFRDWPVRPKWDKATHTHQLSPAQLTRVLGVLMFGLDLEYDQPYVPTFRSLISYFIRRGGEHGGFLNPFTHFARQKEWDKQVNNAFLLMLEWEHASRWQVLKDREAVLTQIRQEATSGVLSNLVGSVGKLEAEKLVLEQQAQDLRRQLENYQVHPQYRSIQAEADELTSRIHQAINKAVTNRRLLESYESGLKEEKEPSSLALEELYREAGVVLPELVKKRFADVQSFHHQVVENRQEFLRSEIERLKREIREAEHLAQKLDTERSERLAILRTHRALDEHSAMQRRYNDIQARQNDVSARLENMKRFEQGASALKIEKEMLAQQARIDLEERKNQRQTAISLFNASSEALYDAPGRLSIDVGATGFRFDVDIERSGSGGIDNMKVLCYDLTSAQIWAKSPVSPGFLVHDSEVFDGVDPRQMAKALQRAALVTQECGFQYICTLNSGNLPHRDFDPWFDLEEYVRIRLTDATPEGGLLGMRF